MINKQELKIEELDENKEHIFYVDADLADKWHKLMTEIDDFNKRLEYLLKNNRL